LGRPPPRYHWSIVQQPNLMAPSIPTRATLPGEQLQLETSKNLGERGVI
jgi:hypothetical protein